MDVAERAATSAPVASRILNGDPTLRVGYELRRRVISAARDLGYRPNAVARGLRRGQTGALALVIPTLTNPAFSRMLREAVSEARARGYAVLLVEDRDEEPDTSAWQLVRSGRIDGLLIASARPRMPLVEALRGMPVPHVFINRAVAGSGRNVLMADAAASRLAVEHLAALGHRRIAHLAAPLDLEPVRRRVDGTVEAARELGLDPPVVVAQLALEDAFAPTLIDGLLDANPDVTAIYACSPLLAAGALLSLRQRRLRVPRDISVLAYTDAPMAAVLDPPLSVVEMPLEELGSAAVRALIDQLGGGAPADVTVATPPRLLLRDSTGRAARARPR